MIEIRKVNAMRLALKLATSGTPIRLDPDGTLWATDHVTLIRSLDAHDADISEPLYVSPIKPVPTAQVTVAFELNVGESLLYDVRPRSRTPHEVKVERDVDYPPVSRVVPTGLAPDYDRVPMFDSIRAGAMASTYGLKVGVWLPRYWDNRLYLSDVEDGDFVVMAGVKMEESA